MSDTKDKDEKAPVIIIPEPRPDPSDDAGNRVQVPPSVSDTRKPPPSTPGDGRRNIPQPDDSFEEASIGEPPSTLSVTDTRNPPMPRDTDEEY